MKKFLLAVAVCLIVCVSLTLVACVDHKGAAAPYHPSSNEIQANLESSGYQVTVTTELDENKHGTHISATKGDEYLEYYVLENSSDCAYFSDKLGNTHHGETSAWHNEHSTEHNGHNSNHTDKHAHGTYENHKQNGNVVYCGTEHAVAAAGIR